MDERIWRLGMRQRAAWPARWRVALTYRRKRLASSISRIYNNFMQITFDSAKDQINTDKHGVSLGAATDFEWDDAVVWADERKAYGEARMCAIGYIGVRLHYVVYVDRTDVRRIISLRKANSREEKRYAET